MGSPILFDSEELIFACPLCGMSMPDIAHVTGGKSRSVSKTNPECGRQGFVFITIYGISRAARHCLVSTGMMEDILDDHEVFFIVSQPVPPLSSPILLSKTDCLYLTEPRRTRRLRRSVRESRHALESPPGSGLFQSSRLMAIWPNRHATPSRQSVLNLLKSMRRLLS